MSYTLVKNLVPQSKWPLKATYPMNATRIVVHNTANDASARNEIAYMISNDNQVSFHIAVDDKEAVQGLPLNRNGWHAGDGNSGAGNREGIGVEICYSRSGGTRFVEAEKNAAELVANLLKERGWGMNRVTKHQDYSGKYCPHRTLDKGWGRFLSMVEANLKGGSDMAKITGKQLTDTVWRYAARKPNGAELENWKGKLTREEVIRRLEDRETAAKAMHRLQNYPVLQKELTLTQAALRTEREITTGLTQQVKDLEAELALVSEDTANLNALGSALRWFIKRVGLKG